MNRSQINSSNNGIYSASTTLWGTLAYTLLLAFFPVSLLSSLDTMALEAISIVIIAITATTVYKLAGNIHPLISLITPAVIFFFFGGSFVIVALAFSLIGAVSLLACLLHKARSLAARLFPIILTVAVYLCASYLSGNHVISLICFAFLPAAFILALCLSKKALRVTTICGITVGLLLPSAAALISYVLIAHKGDMSVVSSAISAAKASFCALIDEYLVSIESLEILDMSGVDRSSLAKQISSLVFNLSPAIVITALNLLAFMLQSFTASMITHGEKDQEKLIALYAFKMSTASAVIFLVFLVLYAMLADEGKAALAMAALNIVIILIPGLLYTTLMMLKRLTHSPKASCFGFILYIGALILLFSLPQYTVLGGAIIGAAILIVNDAKWSIIKNRSSQK